ncbi:IS200/IS605 family transposase [Candidatus Dependentiae bacterium]|nr:IS200/IS605 family transposase [Candidatus Dependentiae bacterium]MCC7414907.1 IS200/IS605 family transposase [Campylobacterota bacterium]
MSRFKKLTHSIWHCHYHVVWTPKYRYRVLTGKVKKSVENLIRIFSEKLDCTIVEMNVQIDHIHLVVMVPPKISISTYMGTVKGRSVISVFKQVPNLKQKPYWGNHFWTRGYCVDTVGLDLEKIRKYVKYQEQQEKLAEIQRC